MTVESRSVVVRLSAETAGFIRDMKKAGASGTASMTQLEQGTKKAGGGLDDLGVSAGTMAAGVGLAVVKTTMDFDKGMSAVQAATHASTEELGLLRDAAKEAGAETAFSATEAAAGIENLAKAGISTADILDGGLSGALDLAAAGGLSVADAAEAAAGAMAQFKLKGDQATHVADLLAAGAGKAQGDVSDMVMALKQAGTVSAQTGLSIEETTGTLAALAEQSLLGSDAGTSFKTMLAALTPNSNAARKAMEQYNIQAFDAQGNFVGMTELAGQLRAGLSGLTDEQRAMALETIFGSDAVRAAAIVYDNGAEGIQKWIDSTNDAGYAAETASIKLDNLAGDVEALGGALQSALIEQGEGSTSSLRLLTQALTETVNAVSAADAGVSGFLDGLAPNLDDVAKAYLGGPVTLFAQAGKDLKQAFEGPTTAGGTQFQDMLDNASGGLIATAMASDGLTSATGEVDHAMRKAAQQTEAEAEALKDARDAARDTAGEFFNLGESLNDSSVSMGQWIRDMAQQADALNNFTVNAQRAGRRGLREGLIRDLQAAGAEGALRMRQLANATDAEIDRANAAWLKGQRAIDRYVDATTKVPGDKSTRVTADTRQAASAIIDIGRMLNDIDGTTAITYVETRNRLVGSKSGTSANPTNNALGDVKDRHSPEIAPGGAWRVWAEPETQGESYIPHANDSRRPRARAILEETASILGARSVEWYAAGGASDSPERTKRERERREAARRRAEERRQRRLDNQLTKDLLASDLTDDEEQAVIEVMDARRRLRSAKKADRPKGEINELKLALKQERTDLNEMREQKRIEAKEKKDQELAKAEEERLKAEEVRAAAILDGQQRAWDTAADAVKAQVDAAQALVDSVASSMDRIGKAATAAFEGSWFSGGGQHGLWVGPGGGGAGGDWRSRATASIEGLREKSSLIAQLSSLGLSGAALEDLLGNQSNEGISAMLAAGEVDDYAALFAEREKLLGEVSSQAGVAGYGQEYAAASAQLVMTNQKLDLLNALIAQARPITVTETVSAAVLAAEIARLQAATGGF